MVSRPKNQFKPAGTRQSSSEDEDEEHQQFSDLFLATWANGLVRSTGPEFWYSHSMGASKVRRSMATRDGDAVSNERAAEVTGALHESSFKVAVAINM